MPKLNRTAKIVIFIVVASVANIVLMGLLFIGLMSLYLAFIAPLLPRNVNTILGLVIFCVAIVLTFIIYKQFIVRYGEKFKIQNLIAKK